MKFIQIYLPVRTVFANLLVGKDSLKCVFEDLLSTHFLFKKEFYHQRTDEGKTCAVMANWRAVNYFQMLVKLVHQAGEELVGVLLLSDIQLLVPHLENLQHEKNIFGGT